MKTLLFCLLLLGWSSPGWADTIDGYDQAKSVTVCSYDGNVPPPLPKDPVLGEYTQFTMPPCDLPYAYVFNPTDQLWHRASDPACLDKMEQAMRAMDEFIARGLWPTDPKDIPGQAKALVLWREAKQACWKEKP